MCSDQPSSHHTRHLVDIEGIQDLNPKPKVSIQASYWRLRFIPSDQYEIMWSKVNGFEGSAIALI